MYTQCPECGVAFRVTAEVLKQAAGKVRCGGCGVAFNALDHLSENEPAEPVRAEPAREPQTPGLASDAAGELEAGTPPKSISAEQSAALLKTLDQLAGSDIRIEDTGIEWRVLGEDEEEDTSDDASTEDESNDESSVDAMLEGSFKPIDEVITESASVDETPEVVEEMRFDDNTPLPEDFDFESAAPAPAVASAIEKPEPVPEPAQAQVDLAFGDPDEWEDLLGDLDEPAKPVAEEAEQAQPAEEPAEPEAAAEPAAEPEVAEEPAEVADLALEQPPDMDTQFAIQAEAMGIDLSGLHATRDDQPEEVADEETVEAGVSSETSIEEDLIAAAFETEEAERRRDTGKQILEPEEIAELEALELEALSAEDSPDQEPEVEALEEDEAPEDEPEPEPEELEEEAAAEDEDESIELELQEEIEPEDEPERKGDVDDIARIFDDKVEEVIETMSASLDDDSSAPETEDAGDEHLVPEMTEEEKTINMLIDEELFNIAVEDEEGFASTIVQLQPRKKVEQEIGENKEEKKEKKKKFDKPPLVETIIMEGESIHAELGDEEKPRQTDTPGISLPLPNTPDDYMRRGQIEPPRSGMIAGAAALLVLLALQALHQSREALATVPAFNKAVGPVYRMLGKPLTPTWDISGWRFEATKGSTDEDDELLTIYSRVGNESDNNLPYPLVHVSLTDRFEEIIGSRVLEPAEYLPENADPRKLVPAGNTFNAVISIASPTAGATGFKLNVCYRLANGRLRCAIEDFK